MVQNICLVKNNRILSVIFALRNGQDLLWRAVRWILMPTYHAGFRAYLKTKTFNKKVNLLRFKFNKWKEQVLQMIFAKKKYLVVFKSILKVFLQIFGLASWRSAWSKSWLAFYFKTDIKQAWSRGQFHEC